MKVLIVGSGGREHAIAWKVAQSKKVDKISHRPATPAKTADIHTKKQRTHCTGKAGEQDRCGDIADALA